MFFRKLNNFLSKSHQRLNDKTKNIVLFFFFFFFFCLFNISFPYALVQNKLSAIRIVKNPLLHLNTLRHSADIGIIVRRLFKKKISECVFAKKLIEQNYCSTKKKAI